jgi:hypothetical protein
MGRFTLVRLMGIYTRSIKIQAQPFGPFQLAEK